MAAAYAENGEFEKAITSEQEAISKAKELRIGKNHFIKKYDEIINKGGKLLNDAYRRRKSYVQYQQDLLEKYDDFILNGMEILEQK